MQRLGEERVDSRQSEAGAAPPYLGLQPGDWRPTDGAGEPGGQGSPHDRPPRPTMNQPTRLAKAMS